MPIMRAARPEAKQRIGDRLYSIIQERQGKLAAKIVGMLLEGFSEPDLEHLLTNEHQLNEEVESAVYLLKIQDSDTSDWSRLECNRALQELEYALYSEPPHCANASWSIADLAMLSSWRNLIGGRAKIIRRLIDLLDGNPWESKNAALCLGNLCCDCPINQVIIGTTTIGTRTIFSGLVRLVLHSKDETTKIFACLAINNLACNIENAHNICLFPFAIPGAIKSKYMIVSEFSAGT
mmetsp:Transcript_40082/g.126008  ORF Transcript_40082/g.126008 Transcript_40082/m.126008 type:complete len:236 (+) Transcript_40082:35-742(+)